jgi:hypothetical protein
MTFAQSFSSSSHGSRRLLRDQVPAASCGRFTETRAVRHGGAVVAITSIRESLLAPWLHSRGGNATWIRAMAGVRVTITLMRVGAHAGAGGHLRQGAHDARATASPEMQLSFAACRHGTLASAIRQSTRERWSRYRRAREEAAPDGRGLLVVGLADTNTGAAAAMRASDSAASPETYCNRFACHAHARGCSQARRATSQTREHVKQHTRSIHVRRGAHHFAASPRRITIVWTESSQPLMHRAHALTINRRLALAWCRLSRSGPGRLVARQCRPVARSAGHLWMDTQGQCSRIAEHTLNTRQGPVTMHRFTDQRTRSRRLLWGTPASCERSRDQPLAQ